MDYDNLLHTAGKVVADTQWFNGSSDSIFNRLDRIQEILGDMRMAASSPNTTELELQRYASYITELDEERDQLERLASNYVDFDTEEYLQSLPGGTVASTYRMTTAGTRDLGEDDGSFLFRAAKTVEDELRDADWINFVTAGAEIWVEDQHLGLLNDQLSTREAAVYYVEQKTLPILDVVKRASIIDNFVDNVEICRRTKKDVVEAKREVTAKKVRLASTFNETSVNDAFGDSVNWL